METLLGRLAWSKAGRDSGKLMVIVGIADGEHVLVADGSLRRIEKPKKKKLKHLTLTNKTAACFIEAKNPRKDITNGILRSELQQFAEETLA